MGLATRVVSVVVLVAACGSSADQDEFLRSTQSLGISDEDRLGAGEAACDYLDKYRVEFHEPLGEPYHFAFDDLYRFARNAGASVDQAIDLTGAAVAYLCPYESYVEAWGDWLRTADIETLLNE